MIARTEALIAGASVAEALDRAAAYAEAGEDAILVHSKWTSPQQLINFARQWSFDIPLVSVSTTYDETSAEVLHQLGYRVILRESRPAIGDQGHGMQSPPPTAHRARCGPARSHGSSHRVFELVGLDELRRKEGAYLTFPR